MKSSLFRSPRRIDYLKLVLTPYMPILFAQNWVRTEYQTTMKNSLGTLVVLFMQNIDSVTYFFNYLFLQVASGARIEIWFEHEVPDLARTGNGYGGRK